MRWGFILRGLGVIALFVAVGYLLGGLVDEAWIDARVRGHGLAGELLYLGVGGLLVAAGVSRQFVSFLGGYAFGFLAGTALALGASALGCALAFLAARLLGRRWVSGRMGERLARIDRFIHDNPFSMTLLIRLLPVGNNLAVNLAAGVSSVRALPFLAGSALGYLPQTAIFALVGSGVNVDPALRIGVAVVAFVLMSLLSLYLYRRYRHGVSLDSELDSAP